MTTEEQTDEQALVPTLGGAMEVSPELAAELAELQQTGEELGGSLLDMLAIYSADGERWKTGETKKDEVVGIFLHGVPGVRSFWPAEVPLGTEPPTCWSLDGEVPAPTAIEPQNETCEGCPWDEFGTAKIGAGKGCSTKRADFFVEIDPEQLDTDGNGNYAVTAESVLGIALIRGSATSRQTRRSIAEWAKDVRSQANGVTQLVLTRWKLVTAKSKNGTAFNAPTLKCLGRYVCDTEALQEIVKMSKELRGGEANNILTALAGSAEQTEDAAS